MSIFLVVWLLRILATPIRARDITGGAKSIAMAVAEGLHSTNAVSVGVEGVRVIAESDGYYRCYLEGASVEETRLFAGTLDEAISPLGRPRAIMPRIILCRESRIPRWVDAIGVQLNVVDLEQSTGGIVVAYHNVPEFFSANGTRMNAFEGAWHRYVSPGRPLYSHGNLAKEIISVFSGQNPLEVSTQARTLWR